MISFSNAPEKFFQMCESCGTTFQQTPEIMSNFCPTCSGKIFMGRYSKTVEDSPSIKELLELSTLYHGLITDLADTWNVELTPALRAQAFQIVTDFSEQVRMKASVSGALMCVEERLNRSE